MTNNNTPSTGSQEVTREIKFRGRCVITGNWAYGYYYPSKGNAIIRDDKDCETIVMPASVGQYSGKKDKCGMDIYEGDICVWPSGNLNKIIFTERACFSSVPIDKATGGRYGICTGYIKIIGNIYENPELLNSIK